MIIGFVLLSFSSWCQKGKLTFENTNLHDVIIAIEKETNYVFNYEPSLLKEHTYSGKLNSQLSQADLTDLLFDSPFLFELDATTIIIYLPEPMGYRVCGTLRDALSQSPLIAANVYVQELDSGVQSDEHGFFDLSISGYKNQKITMSYIGYESISFTLQELSKDTCIDYALGINDNVWGKEIVVTDYILDGITEGEYYGGYNLDYNQLSKYHSTVEHDILKTAQLLPGIHSFDESATNLQFRGGSPDQNLILWEGATLYQTGHLFGMISAINPFSVNEINIFKNTYDPIYDNRIGGIIDISLSDSLSTKSRGSVGTTLTEAHVNLELPLISDKFSVLLSGRHSINAIYNSPPLQSYTSKVFQYNKIDDQSEDAQEGFLNAEQVLRFHDWNAKVLYRPTDRVFVRAGMYVNNQRFQYNLSFPDNPWIATDNLSVYTSAVHADLDWQASHNLATSISVQKSEYDNTYDYKEIELGEQLTRYDQSNAIEDKSITWSNSYKYSNNLSLSAGYNYNRIDVNYEVDDTESYEPLYSDRSTEAAHFHNVFASADYSYHRLNINGGARISRYLEEQEWVYSPRLNLQFSLSKNLKLKSEAGIFHQFISQLDEFGTNALQVDNPLWVINTSVSDTYHQANKISGGFIFDNNGWLIDTEAYYNKVDGLSSISPLFNLINTNEFAIGSSSAKGIDVLLKKRWKAINAWINYSLSEVNYLFPDISEIPFAAPNDIRHNLNGVGSYKFKNLLFSVSAYYHSGLPFSLPIGVYDYFDEDFQETIYSVDYVDINRDRLQDYVRLDLSINYRPTFRKLTDINCEFSISLINVLNRENIFAREYFVDFNTVNEVPTLAFVNKELLRRTPLILFRVYW